MEASRKRTCWVSESVLRMWNVGGAVTQGGRGGLAYGCFGLRIVRGPRGSTAGDWGSLAEAIFVEES